MQEDLDLKEIRKQIAAENGRKGAQTKWSKYPAGSIERLAMIAPLIEGRRKKAKQQLEDKQHKDLT